MVSQALTVVPQPPTNKRKGSRKHNTPHLPKQLLQDLLKEDTMEGLHSLVFGAFMNKVRIDVVDVNRKEPLHPDQVVPPDQGKMNPLQRTMLHYATLKTDHLVVFEMIRLGAKIDGRDAKGETALSMAFDMWSNAIAHGVPQEYAQHPKAFFQRLRRIIYALIEQHADVNLIINGQTYMHRACTIGDWGLIGKLMMYGADPEPVPISTTPVRSPISLLPPQQRSRYRRLASQCASVSPPRVCPCWSGKILPRCHGRYKDLKYPAHFRCICGSGKSCSSCSCSQRNSPIVEHYESDEDRIVARFDRDVPFDINIIKGINVKRHWLTERIMKAMEFLNTLLDVERPAAREATYIARMVEIRKLADKLVLEGLVDPAYAYALRRVNFHPRPQGRTIDKRHLKIRQTAWNTAVEKYIKSGVDTRPRIEIEREAKLALSLGALHRVCENPDCSKMEGKDCKSLRTCGQCKIRVYCSAECQLKVWPTHKKECGHHSLREQLLPSQYNMLEYAKPLVAQKFQEVFDSIENVEDYKGLEDLQRAVSYLSAGEALPQDLIHRADLCRERSLLLKSKKLPLWRYSSEQPDPDELTAQIASMFGKF